MEICSQLRVHRLTSVACSCGVGINMMSSVVGPGAMCIRCPLPKMKSRNLDFSKEMIGLEHSTLARRIIHRNYTYFPLASKLLFFSLSLIQLACGVLADFDLENPECDFSPHPFGKIDFDVAACSCFGK